MATLLIQHQITDFDQWRAAFDRLAAAREQAGVRAERIQRPVDDLNYVVVELDFDDTPRAQEFLTFLHDVVWASPENAPALVGRPKALVMTPAS